MCMGILSACMSVHYVPAWFLWRLEEDIRSPETQGTDVYQPSSGCWESNLLPLQEELVLLTTWAISPALIRPDILSNSVTVLNLPFR